MTICRYFAQGNCRFGDRCRFDHIDNGYNYNKQSFSKQWNVENHEDRYGSNNNRYGNEYKNQRYDSKNYYEEDYKGYASDTYNDKYARSSNVNNQYQYKNKQGYDPHFRAKKQNQYSHGYEKEATYGQNRYKWLSDDYRNQSHLSFDQNEYEYENDSYTTSTPKGKPSFSFKVPESEVKKGSNHFYEFDEQDVLLTEKVQEDAKAWEVGGQWPFTCYFPYPYKCAFPGFYDVSPEELRYVAYKAEENNSSTAYVQAVQTALNQIGKQRSELQIATPQILTTLRKINSGEDVYSTSRKINPLASVGTNDNVEIMEMPDISAASNNAAASFSFKMPSAVSNATSAFSFKLPTETDSAVNTSASSFSFKMPFGSETKSSIVSNGDVNIYTQLEKLTEAEKEQFSASTFILGKIPTKPPSLVFCN